MKKTVCILLAAVFTVCAVFGQDKVEGLWKSIDDKDGKVTAAWKIYQKDNKLFGEILVVPNQADSTLAYDCKGSYSGFPVAGDVSKMTVINTPFIFNLKMKNPGLWEGGNIIDPKDGKMYKCKITFHPADGKKYKKDTLEMRGEIGMGIGRSQFWERATEEDVASYRMK